MQLQVQERVSSQGVYAGNNLFEFFGKTIVTPHREYGINSYGKLTDVFTCPIEIDQVFGLDTRVCNFLINNPKASPSRRELEELLEKYGKQPKVGLGLVILLSEIDADKRGCRVNSLIDYPITKIK